MNRFNSEPGVGDTGVLWSWSEFGAVPNARFAAEQRRRSQQR